ncbi:hypothetical protein HCG49_00855 [Arenibacter sp. 6A1]|uniref:hypothetical protein n=1 Tax=Arenibacter sp. 6A1 TaxID=2720391 RepID=UPI00144683DD|nr:hypothetical protein [Arenibacter sp. 6A1]NKI25106.1 hypothetical protein [Arenibacter sp. 6A1]
MKTILYIVVFVLSQSLFGQVVYQPTFIDQCTNKPIKEVMWMISDSTQIYGNEYLGMDYAKLPRLGNYELNCTSISDTPMKIRIAHNETVKDTFFLKRLLTVIQLNHDKTYSDTPPKYYVCNADSLANGTVIDFYSNGKIRDKGIFEKGKLIDTLYTYHRNGKLSKLTIPHKKGYKTIHYPAESLKR